MDGSASVDDDSAGSLVINGSAICQADSRGTGGGTKEIAAQEVSGESEKKETNREDKAEMESGKEPKGSR